MNELTIIPPQSRELTPNIWQMINDMAPVMHRSRMFGVTSVEQATAIMLKGYEMGLSITASFELIQVIQGKPGLSPRGAMALLLNSPKIKNIEIKEISEKNQFVGYSCRIERTNGFSYEASFTMEDAQRAGLIKTGGGWESYPQNMCRWRAVGFAADVAAPDITSGMTGIMKMPEQYNVELTTEGDILPVDNVIDMVSNEITLDGLLKSYSAEAIVEANGGTIPSTQEEIEQVAEKLRGQND